jgi:hypothetical protein
MEKYIIIKKIKGLNGTTLPVILVNSISEILEFDSLEEAESLRSVLQANTDSGHVYEIRKIANHH